MSEKIHTGNIELHIDKLLLHGVPRGDRHRIGEAVRQELIRQIGERGIPGVMVKQDINVPRLNAGSIQTEVGGKPERVGTQVGQAVYRSLTGNANGPRGNN
jgi:hypothetical protein